ncbi:MAG: serine hydrolase [SAR202 cluster bacterium]|nr:serine hydrolase [SAR202 cluster bacterium]
MGRLPQSDMDALAASFDGRVGFYVKDLASGACHAWNADWIMPTASICKMPVMVDLFKQAREGKLSLDDRHTLPSGISALGTGVLSSAEDPPTLTLRDYCRLMITVSDNMATDMLIGLLGTANINATMKAMGLLNTATTMTLGAWHYSMRDMVDTPGRESDEKMREKGKSMRPNPDSIAYARTLANNVTSARDMGVLLERTYYGQVVSPQASWGMMEMLKDCQSRTKIPGRLKPDVVVAHKIGGSNRIQGDVGIVLLPTGPLVVSVLTLAKEPEHSKQAVELIAELSRMAVGAFSPESIAI